MTKIICDLLNLQPLYRILEWVSFACAPKKSPFGKSFPAQNGILFDTNYCVVATLGHALHIVDFRGYENGQHATEILRDMGVTDWKEPKLYDTKFFTKFQAEFTTHELEPNHFLDYKKLPQFAMINQGNGFSFFDDIKERNSAKMFPRFTASSDLLIKALTQSRYCNVLTNKRYTAIVPSSPETIDKKDMPHYKSVAIIMNIFDPSFMYDQKNNKIGFDVFWYEIMKDLTTQPL